MLIESEPTGPSDHILVFRNGVVGHLLARKLVFDQDDRGGGSVDTGCQGGGRGKRSDAERSGVERSGRGERLNEWRGKDSFTS